jgi:hypothetical protein
VPNLGAEEGSDSVTPGVLSAISQVIAMGLGGSAAAGAAPVPDGLRGVQGISGHQAPDMQARFQRDVLAKKPDLVWTS